MVMSHKVFRVVFAFAVGLMVAIGSFQWISDSERSVRRAEEEAIVIASRDILRGYVADEGLEISDAVDRVRAAGKVYLFPTDAGWELSGHYRRRDEKTWHAYLMSVDANAALIRLSVQDGNDALASLAASDPKFTASK